MDCGLRTLFTARVLPAAALAQDGLEDAPHGTRGERPAVGPCDTAKDNGFPPRVKYRPFPPLLDPPDFQRQASALIHQVEQVQIEPVNTPTNRRELDPAASLTSHPTQRWLAQSHSVRAPAPPPRQPGQAGRLPAP